MNSPLLSAELARSSVEALRLERGRGPVGLHAVLVVLAAVGFGALAWVQVDVFVTAAGVVRPATERIELRAPATGRIGRVAVRDNAPVAAGDLLVELALPDVDQRLARNRRLQEESRELLAWLDALTLAPASVAPARLPPGPDAAPSPARRTLDQEHRELEAQLAAQRVAEAGARLELARRETLAAAGLATVRERDEARFALQRTEAETAWRIEQARTRWQRRREEAAAALDALAAEAAQLATARAAAELRAPLAGTVLGFAGLGAGAPVVAGQNLGSLSPDDRLVVETRVASRDIAALRPAQTVRLQVDAFPSAAWGTLEASVLSIAADADRPAGGGPPGFKVLVEPRATALRRPDGRRGELGRGMTVTARFLTDRRSVLALLRQRAGDWLDPRPPATHG